MDLHEPKLSTSFARWGRLLPLLLLASVLPASAQPIARGTTYLLGSQAPDGSWSSPSVRPVQASAESLRALQEVAPGEVVARGSAAAFLVGEVGADSDDRAHRLAALAREAGNVGALATRLVADRDAVGGWGLTADFANDPLRTALALSALAGRAEANDEVIRTGLLRLLVSQQADGGFPCVDVAGSEAASELYCTAQALSSLLPYRSRFVLDSAVNGAVAFLRDALQPDGRFGPPGEDAVVHTAAAALALAAVPAFGNEVVAVTGFLSGQQEFDGSWQGDPYVTALALRALDALAGVPFCGDGVVNTAAEACDLGVPAGLSCQSLGLGPGTLACSAGCTLDTSGCSAAPICGDNLRNQPFEFCDGTDVAGESCRSQGFEAGTLRCAADCSSFDVGSCSAAPSCGDGIVNQPGEACDLSDLNGASCSALGLGGGLLQCANDCSFDTRQCDTASFVLDNKGREFFVGFMPNPLGAATASVNLTADEPTTVTVQYPAGTPTFQQSVNVGPGQITVVNLPANAHSGWSAGRVLDNAVRVSSTSDFVVYLVNRAPFTSDAGMALPVDALGTSYIVTTARGSAIVGQDRTQFLVLAPFDDTTVTITPKTDVRIPSPGTNRPPNVPFSIQLGRGQGFRAEAVNAGTDFTGTLIESTRPIALLNGNLCTNVPSTTAFCDHIFEVAHPLRSWGRSALVANLPNRPGGSVYRIVASEDDTRVTLDGALLATLNRGQLFETGRIAGNHAFDADKPIFVTQFMTGSTSPGAILGDPAMANMIPPDQYLKEYTFSTIGGGQFRNHFLTVIAPDASLGQVLLDGTPIPAGSFTPIATTGFSSALLPLPEGSHTTSSPQPHGITVQGLNQDDSYIYPGGAQLAFINQFCGDGAVNREPEQCDGSDFNGQTCAAFGFSAGFLRCTPACLIDTSSCTGIASEDGDGDGYPGVDDCNDSNPNVNPGEQEIPGNGLDDDCNPATPDDIPVGSALCSLVSARLAYGVADLVTLTATITNEDPSASLAGLDAMLVVEAAPAAPIFDEARALSPLPPTGRSVQTFAFPAAGSAPGSYLAQLTLSAGAVSVAQCAVAFTIDGSAASGAGLGGTLTLTPSTVNAGDATLASYTVTNVGNEALNDLALRVVFLDPDTGGVLGELNDATSLGAGASFTASQPFSTATLLPKVYLAVLRASLGSAGVELTLDEALLTVVNVPPICTGATATVASLWPPNHRMEPVSITGVVDPDGDPVSFWILGVSQDEPTESTGDGNFCPDATGVGTATASVRVERRGSGDGRVYHIRFLADDGRGGTCESVATLCVPKSQGGNGRVCGDQGPIFDSTRCP